MQQLSQDDPLRLPKPVLEPHCKALENHPAYEAEGVRRIPVPRAKVEWSVPFPEYDAVLQATFDHPRVLREYAEKGDAGWAASPEQRALIGTTKSYETNLPVNSAGEVLNPGGRTGIKDGRGLLAQRGPNFAADPILFRFHPLTGELEICLIERSDTGTRALPGGMVDFGELITDTLQRELGEESGFVCTMDDATVIYRGYVDDPRNTDTAWIETTAAYKLLSVPEAAHAVLHAGSDAQAAAWVRVEPDVVRELYANHGLFVRRALANLASTRGDELASVALQIAAAMKVMN